MRILIVGDSVVSLELLAALARHDLRSDILPPVAVPVREPVLDLETIDRFERAMRTEYAVHLKGEWNEPEPFMPDGRVRMGKGEKRRLKKQRGW